jgi:hypothetical protein
VPLALAKLNTDFELPIMNKGGHLVVVSADDYEYWTENNSKV